MGWLHLEMNGECYGRAYFFRIHFLSICSAIMLAFLSTSSDCTEIVNWTRVISEHGSFSRIRRSVKDAVSAGDLEKVQGRSSPIFNLLMSN